MMDRPPTGSICPAGCRSVIFILFNNETNDSSKRIHHTFGLLGATLTWKSRVFFFSNKVAWRDTEHAPIAAAHRDRVHQLPAPPLHQTEQPVQTQRIRRCQHLLVENHLFSYAAHQQKITKKKAHPRKRQERVSGEYQPRQCRP